MTRPDARRDARERALERLTAEARREHERAVVPDVLSPEMWSRIRCGVDRAADTRGSRKRWLLWTAFGALATAVAVVFVVTRGASPSASPSPIALASIDGRALTNADLTIARPVIDPTHMPGERLAGGPEGHRYAAYGRHTIDLAPNAIVRVEAWSRDAMALVVEQGAATFEVERASPSETFTVASGAVQVHVKGTIFTVLRGADATTEVSVARGRVLVSEPDHADVSVSAGEHARFGAAQSAAVEAPAEARPKRPGGRTPANAPRDGNGRVIDIDVGVERAPDAQPGEVADVSRVLPAILGTIRAGRCTQALKALGELERGLGAETPRNAVWLKAYCLRKGGDVAGSAALFARYGAPGTASPWVVPSGDELPPLP